MEVTTTLVSICLGVGLATAAGFRIFLPLLATSLAAYFDFIALNDSWAWLGSLTAVFTFGVAALVETAAFYIPWVDNLLDTIALPIATLAGTIIMVATISDVDPALTWILAIIAGGGTAAIVKGNAAVVRAGSTATTGGVGNPIVTTVETGTATILSAASVFVPILAAAMALILLLIIIRFYKKLRKKRPSAR
ncbi:DUF4126 domain-containing protein [Flavobacteriaceae bacterium TK19130]|nr:DUF4126 domain-containing protein [Thermobacterium salinum]